MDSRTQAQQKNQEAKQSSSSNLFGDANKKSTKNN
jgi:hypothetical protein